MKNLCYIFADQWRYHALGFANEDRVFTPHMDAFASQAVHCTQAVSSYPLCSPHRAALLTGKYPLSCGMWTNCKLGIDPCPELKQEETLISDVASAAGYDTAYIGKWHLTASEQNFTEHPISGARNWDAYTPVGPGRHNFRFWYSYGANDEHLNPHYWKDTPEKISVSQWSAEHETDVAIEYLETIRDKEKPFCLFLSWNPPHPPYELVPHSLEERHASDDRPFRLNVPKSWCSDDSFKKARAEYYAAIEGLDEQFGRLVAYLKQAGLWDDTIVALSADHGDCMGSHGLYGKNVWYEEAIRIPLLIKTDRVEGSTYAGLIPSCDQMPTLLELMGLAIPKSVEGVSHAKAFADPFLEVRSNTYLCMIPGMPELVQAFVQQQENHKAYGWRGIRTKNKLYVVDNGSVVGAKQERYLYDLEQDPYQMHPLNLQPDDERCRDWDTLLQEYAEKQHDPFLLEKV